MVVTGITGKRFRVQNLDQEEWTIDGAIVANECHATHFKETTSESTSKILERLKANPDKVFLAEFTKKDKTKRIITCKFIRSDALGYTHVTEFLQKDDGTFEKQYRLIDNRSLERVVIGGVEYKSTKFAKKRKASSSSSDDASSSASASANASASASASASAAKAKRRTRRRRS